MKTKEMLLTILEIVVDNFNEYHKKDRSEWLTVNDLFVVWQCKVLRNFKCLISTTKVKGLYYEVTYNGETNEYYVDFYRKVDNKVVFNHKEEK